MLSGNPDCVHLDATPTDMLPSVRAIHVSGQKIRVRIDIAVASADKLKALGAAADGAYG